MSSAPGIQPEWPSQEAPADVLRLIAHDLRQPLSTIESIAYYLSLVLPRGTGEEAKIHEQLQQIQQLVEQSSWILTSGVQLTDISRAAPVPLDLEPLIVEVLSTRSHAEEPAPGLEFAGNLPPVDADPDLTRALIQNLLTLFRQLSTQAAPVTLRTRAKSQRVWLELSTAAPGYRSEAALGPGTGLSLASARRIVEAHSGSFELSVDAAAGVRLLVGLPRAVLP